MKSLKIILPALAAFILVSVAPAAQQGSQPNRQTPRQSESNVEAPSRSESSDPGTSALESPESESDIPYADSGAHGAYGYGLSYNYAPYYGQDIGVERSLQGDGQTADDVEAQQREASNEEPQSGLSADRTERNDRSRESSWLGTGADMDSSQSGMDLEGNDSENYVSSRRSDAAEE